MKTSIALVSLLALTAAAMGCTGSPADGISERSSDLTVAPKGPDAQPFISCREMVDHGAEVTFFAGAGHEIVRADYTETDFVETRLVSSMTVCTTPPAAPPVPDAIVHSATCNDLNWTQGYHVELYTGGFANVPSIKLFQSSHSGAPIHALNCRYVTP